jgi:predicted transcriptional regulator
MTVRDKVKTAIIDYLSKISSATFDEIYDYVARNVKDVRKIEVREILSDLIREGVVRREPDYERRRMVFKYSGQK